MKKVFYIFLFTTFIGCGTALKNSWTNFRAYYNTYYNAKKSFEAGLDKIEDQQIEVDVSEPLRVHPEPLSAGEEDFQKAIDKGAQILRKFPDSKWVDETLELIGKSFYFRQEYYSALRKFEEQYNVTDSPEMRQRAIIWKGRVLLDLELYDEGVLYLQDVLDKLPEQWEKELHGEAQIVMAEHHVQLQNWDQVINLLQEALIKVDKSTLRARGFFLYGQILEARERHGEAYFAYTNVTNNRPGFELLYWANLKRAETLRSMGNLDEASAIYKTMRKDDKNVQKLDNILYGIARMEEEKGNIEQAEQNYKSILQNNRISLSPLVRSQTYLRLGRIYTQHYQDYKVAAAYYDSSSSSGTTTDQGIFAEDLNSQTLALAYGEYTDLQNQIQHIDSLLWLGSLPAAKFDSVIARIRKKKLQELREQNKERDKGSNVLTNIRNQQVSGIDRTESNAYGFLNYRNTRLVAEASNQFRAIWGSRALADNWRRIEAVRNIEPKREKISSAFNGSKEKGQKNMQVEIDISEIPFSEEQREQKRSEQAIAKYEMGNLLLMTLELPDSAAQYFKSVIQTHPDHALVPKALYSLFEVYISKNDTVNAKKWAARLRNEYPNSIYTRQLNQRLNYPQAEQHSQVRDDLQSRASRILASSTTTAEIAEELRGLALANKQTSAASRIHYEAIRQYIKLAKEKTPPVIKNPNFTFEKDSSAVDPSSSISYEGAYWDSVRTVLDEHEKNFVDRSLSGRVQKLTSVLGKPAPSMEEIKSCKELGITPDIKSGMDKFMAEVQYPDSISSKNISGTVDYEFVLSTSGEILSFQLVSKKTNLGIEESLATAIENSLEFLPIEVEGISKVRCVISFPVDF